MLEEQDLKSEAETLADAAKANASKAKEFIAGPYQRFETFYATWYLVSTDALKAGMDDTKRKILAARLSAQDAAKEAELANQGFLRIKNIPDSDTVAIKQTFNEIEAHKVRTDEDVVRVTKNNWAKFKPQDPDPPIDSLSHSVQFIVAYGAGISPNWVLLQWKGPASSGSLASLGGGRTHTLNLTLGPSKGEQSRALQTLAIQQINH
jgi:hypothetical protein